MDYLFKKIRLVFGTPPLSPLHADTLFGHICWAIRDTEGECALTDFISKMKSAAPPLIISDFLPAGYLPKPIDGSRLPDGHPRAKEFKRLRWVRMEDAASSVTPEQITDRMQACGSYDYGPRLEAVHVMRSANDRLTGKALDSALFSSRTTYCPDGYDIYIAAKDASWSDRIHGLTDFLKKADGYGADKTSGYGQIDSIAMPEIPKELASRLTVCPEGPCMLLSGAVPVGIDLDRSTYRIRVKYGRLGGDFAHGNPFKRPLAYLEPGSIVMPKTAGSFIGGMIENVSIAHPEVVQYGLGIGLGR